MSLERFRIATFFIVLFLALITCFLLVKPFLYILAWSTILAVISYPLYKRLLKRITDPSICALATLTIIITLVVIPLIFISAYTLKEGVTFVNHLPQHINEIKLKKYTELINIPLTGNLYNFFKEYTNFFDINIGEIVKEKVELISSLLVKQSIGFLKNTVSGIIQFVIILLTSYFLLKDSPKLLNLIKIFIPLDENQTLTLINKVGETIYTTVYVVLIVAIIQGSLGGLAFWFLGLKSPILWGIIMAVFCLIPLVGHPFVWVPASVLLLLQGSYWKAIVLVLWGMLVIGLIDNLIRTVLIGAKTQLHPLIVFFSVLGAVLLIGPIGILLGPVIIVITSFLLEILKLKID